MWARVVEAMLALWLALSGFIFAVPAAETAIWAVNLSAALLVLGFSLACYWDRARRAHLATLAIALAIMIYGLVQPRPVVDWHQNYILVGMLLAMFAIVPSQAELPPRAWRA